MNSIEQAILTLETHAKLSDRGKLDHQYHLDNALQALRQYQEGYPIETAPTDKHTRFMVGDTKGIYRYIVVRTSSDYIDEELFPFHSFLEGVPIHKSSATRWWPLPKGKNDG